MNRRRQGEQYEALACDYLKAQGLSVLERNFRCRQGEVDIIARDGDYLVFVEVKARASSGAGRGAEAVDLKKQKTISRVSLFYLTQHHLTVSVPVRYDVIAFDPAADDTGELSAVWYKNAFPYRSSS